jgi:hypothetical protein
MDLSEVVLDSDIGESVTVSRSNGGVFTAGGWQENFSQIPMFGVVTPADGLKLDQVPEGDRVTGSILFFTDQILYDTKANPNPTASNQGSTSDQLTWQGEQYRVQISWPYGTRGFWKAYCCRMSGE